MVKDLPGVFNTLTPKKKRKRRRGPPWKWHTCKFCKQRFLSQTPQKFCLPECRVDYFLFGSMSNSLGCIDASLSSKCL